MNVSIDKFQRKFVRGSLLATETRGNHNVCVYLTATRLRKQKCFLDALNNSSVRISFFRPSRETTLKLPGSTFFYYNRFLLKTFFCFRENHSSGRFFIHSVLRWTCSRFQIQQCCRFCPTDATNSALMCVGNPTLHFFLH